MMEWVQLAKDLPMEAVIWIIIALLWVVAQVFSQLKEKNRRAQQRQGGTGPQPQPQAAGRRFEDEIKSFLENLGGVTGETEEDMPAETPPRPVERPVAIRRRPPPQPARRVETQVEAAAAAMSRAMDQHGDVLGTYDAFSTSAEIIYDYEAARERFRGAAHAMVDPETFLVDLRSLRVPMIQVPVQMLSISDEIAPRPPMQTTSDLKRALISQIILSPPLAMGEDKSAYERRPA